MTSPISTAAMRRSLLLICISTAAGCAHVAGPVPADALPEIRPGGVPGYLAQDALPNSLSILAAPPAAGTAALTVDEEFSRRSFAQRNTPRWNQAREDADLEFPRAASTYSCALNTRVSERDTPRLYLLLRRTLADAAASTGAAKNRYQRRRPFIDNQQPMCTPDAEARLRASGSYPSGHSTVGWTWALLLAEIAPERSEAIFARGLAYGQSRVVCNVHWQSDVLAGRLMGATTIARLHGEAAFRADVDAARAELAAVRAKGLAPDRDCQAEAAALRAAP